MARSLFRNLLSRLHRFEGRVRFVLARGLGLEGIDTPRNAAVFRTTVGVARIAVLFRVICWAMTLRYSDEGLAASLHSANFADGLGLTAAVAEEAPLFGSESVLRVLIPFVGDFAHPGAGLELLKLSSIPATFFTMCYLLALGVHPSVRLPRSLVIAALGYASFEFHQVLNAMAGLETQLATLFLVMSVYYAVAWRPWSLGLSLGLGLLARPETLIWAVAVLMIGMLRAPRTLPRMLLGAAVPCLPWMVFASWYYGTPVPHAWIACWNARAELESALPQGGIGFWLAEAWALSATEVHALLAPTYGGAGTGRYAFYSPGGISIIAHAMLGCAVLGGMSLFRRESRAMAPLGVAVLLYAGYFLFFSPGQEDWRKAGFAVLLVLLALRGVQIVTATIPNSRLRKAVRTGFCLGYVACFVSVLPVAYHVERQYQRGVVNPTQRAAGRYLSEHMAPGETVASTAPGYIGYYSRAHVLDWPGRGSRAVSDWVRSMQHTGIGDFEHMVLEFQPNYVFLSAAAFNAFSDRSQHLILQSYHIDGFFHSEPDALREVQWLDPQVESLYWLLRRRGPSTATATAP